LLFESGGTSVWAGTVKFSGGICVTMANFVAIGRTIAELWRTNGFQSGGRRPSWI